MKIFFVYLSVALTVLQILPVSPAVAAGIRDVGNGGGASEQLLLYAWTELPRFFEICRAQPTCSVQGRDDAWLRQLESDHARETASGGLRFPIPWPAGRPAPVITGQKVGDIFEIEAASLYDGRAGFPTPASLIDAVRWLTTQLSAHHPAPGNLASWTDLSDRLYVLLKSSLKNRINEINLGTMSHPEVALLTLPSSQNDNQDFVLIGFGDGFRDVMNELTWPNPCAAGTSGQPSFKLMNLYWMAPAVRSARGTTGLILPARGTLRLTCSDGSRFEATSTIEFGARAMTTFPARMTTASPADFLKDPSKFLLEPTAQKPLTSWFDLHAISAAGSVLVR